MKKLEMPPGLVEMLARLSFDGKTRARCWKKLAHQLRETHLSLELSFKIFEQRARAEKNPVQYIYAHIVRSLNSGHSIGTALSRYASPEEVMLIDSGQTAGEVALADGFSKAADLLEKKRRIKGLLVKELAYPCLLLACVIGFMFIISTVLIPQLSMLAPPETWTGAGALLYQVTSFVTSWKGAVTGILVIAAAVLIAFSLKHWAGAGRNIADKLPPWSIYRVFSGVSWLYATAILLQTRELKLVTVLKKSLDSPDTSRYLRSRLQPIYLNTMRGKNLGEALFETPTRWPDASLADDLRTYASLPGFNSQLGAFAEEILNESMERIQRGAGMLGSACLILLIAVIGIILTGVLSIQQQLTQGLA